MKYLLLLIPTIALLIFAIPNNNIFSTMKANKTNTFLQATCEMNGFRGFPRKVTGPIVADLRNIMVLAVVNEDNTERVDIAFFKNKCKRTK